MSVPENWNRSWSELAAEENATLSEEVSVLRGNNNIQRYGA